MKGIVRGISKNRVRCAVATDYGFTVFDITSGETFIGDVIVGNLDDHGDATLRSQGSGQKISAYVEAIQASAEFAQQLLDQM